MTIHIRSEGSVLPISTQLIVLLQKATMKDDLRQAEAITFNFRDPNYSPSKGGYHPVEIRLENKGDHFEFAYITDFSYQGGYGQYELVKELDFDFNCGIAQFLYGGMKRIEEASEIFKIWQDNFVYYATECSAFELTLSLN